MTATDHQSIPETLRELDQWVCWRIECQECFTPHSPEQDTCTECGADITKHPYNPNTGGLASSTDSETWASYADALDYNETHDTDGVGFVFDADGTVAGVDLDDVRDPETGQPTDAAKSIINDLDSYTEVSPSGTGYHVYVHGFVMGKNRADLPDGESHVEMYDSARFFTVTGDRVDAQPEDVEQRVGVLQDVHDEYVLEDNDPEPDENKPQQLVDLDEEELLEKAKNAENGDAFKRLWEGDYSAYPSQSEADLALAGYLAFWTGGDKDQIDKLFRKSGLYRDKWDEDRGGQTYGQRTVAKAVQGRNEFYDPDAATNDPSELDVVKKGGEEADTKAKEATDGSAEYGDDELRADVIETITAADENQIQVATARHRIAQALRNRYHFVMPEREVRGWRETLYVYNDAEGIYEPRGETVVKHTLERIAGDFITNNRVNEIVEKIKRASVQRGEQFKTPPNRLVVGNGILDLHTGELEPYTPYEYHRTKIHVDWNPDAGTPDRVDDFLHEIVADKDVDTLYRLIAHTLYKEYVTEKAAMLIGGGQNGKSVFLDFIQRFLGDENVSHRALQEFQEQFAANQLQGKLANIHPDMGDHAVKDLSTFKKLTGRDQFTADVKYESPITFENYATLLFAANEMPVFGEDNHAVWRRWVYVEFPYEFREDKADAKDPEPKASLMDELTEQKELEALLVRAQSEIERWHNGEDLFADAMPPEAVREKMKKAAEPVYAFAATCLEPAEDEHVAKSTVREAYQAYAEAEDLPRIPGNEFGKRLMEQRDYRIESTQRRVDNRRVNVYQGVKLSARGRQLVGADEPDADDQAQMDDRKPPRKVVYDTLEQMMAENDGEPVPENGVVWASVSNDIGKVRAEHELEELKKTGDIMEPEDGLLLIT